jgi:hypothetical protein
MLSPATAQTDTTSHITRNRGTVVTVVDAISNDVSPGAMNPTPSVHSAKVNAPVTATTAGCGKPACPVYASVNSPMLHPPEQSGEAQTDQDRGPVLGGREPVAEEQIGHEQDCEHRREHP